MSDRNRDSRLCRQRKIRLDGVHGIRVSGRSASRRSSLPATVTLWGLCAAAILPVGCVRRRLTIRTQPAGATVFVDKKPIGISPISTSVTYYGTREIEAVHDGYRTEKVRRKFLPPWYEIPPIDFLAESVWPWELRDERVVDITLVPQSIPQSEVLQARADGYRLQASQELSTPVPAIAEEPVPSGTAQPFPTLPAPYDPYPSSGLSPTQIPTPPSGNPPLALPRSEEPGFRGPQGGVPGFGGFRPSLDPQ